METGILILILVLCISLVYVTELMKKMCNRMSWLQDQFNNFKDYNDKEYVQFNKDFADIEKQFVSIKGDNAKKWAEYSKEYSEVMELLLAKHNEINELRDQLKSLEGKVENYEDDSHDDIRLLRSQLNGLNYRIKKNEENTYNAIKDKVEFFDRQINNLKDMYSKVVYGVSFEKHYNKQISSLHDEINELRDQLKSLEGKVKENEDDNCDNFYTVHSQLHVMDGKIKKNEEACYHIIKDNTDSLQRQVDCLRDAHSNLVCTVAEHAKALNKIRTEMLNKMEEKEENE